MYNEPKANDTEGKSFHSSWFYFILRLLMPPEVRKFPPHSHPSNRFPKVKHVLLTGNCPSGASTTVLSPLSCLPALSSGVLLRRFLVTSLKTEDINDLWSYKDKFRLPTFTASLEGQLNRNTMQIMLLWQLKFIFRNL